MESHKKLISFVHIASEFLSLAPLLFVCIRSFKLLLLRLHIISVVQCLIEDCLQLYGYIVLIQGRFNRRPQSISFSQFFVLFDTNRTNEKQLHVYIIQQQQQQNTQIYVHMIHCSDREPGSQLGLRPICALNLTNKRAIRRFLFLITCSFRALFFTSFLLVDLNSVTRTFLIPNTFEAINFFVVLFPLFVCA